MAKGNNKRPGAASGPTGCNPSDEESAGDPHAICRCRAAVTRAYDGMLGSGVPDSVALEAAIRVYRYHHPKAADDVAAHIVEAWVMRGPLH